eukprot:TRINITY_DN2105_c0_g1_i1.p1 TRINITY_DN2105_c0_g1~~TRINITY_DN2105_c0_g1_i1.p1  ORF type:complete len:121 (-),score=21.84 TRINITY_DN2105_c0_g1_i1:442-804(-)
MNTPALYQFLQDHLHWSQEWIDSKVKQHEEACTVEIWQPFCQALFPQAFICKNLFLKDKKKGKLWLVVAKEDTVIDFKKLNKDFGCSSGTLRFTSDEVLETTLGMNSFLSLAKCFFLYRC